MKIKFLDIVVILVALVLAVSVFVFTRKDGEQPTAAVITCDGQEQRITLPANEQISVNGVVIEVDGYTAYVKESDCPDKTCVKTGLLTLTGERSVCLPNRVILSLEGDGGVHVIVG